MKATHPALADRAFRPGNRSFLRDGPTRLLCVTGILALLAVPAAPAQSVQDPPQNAPVTEPRNAKPEHNVPPAVKGAQAISEQTTKCEERLVVNADALFVPGRWTFNPDAGETMDVLGPMIAKAGKHSARIEAYANSGGSESYNQTLARNRAVTVRGWLANNGYVPEGTPVAGFTKLGSGNKERVEIVMDTCK